MSSSRLSGRHSGRGSLSRQQRGPNYTQQPRLAGASSPQQPQPSNFQQPLFACVQQPFNNNFAIPIGMSNRNSGQQQVWANNPLQQPRTDSPQQSVAATMQQPSNNISMAQPRGRSRTRQLGGFDPLAPGCDGDKTRNRYRSPKRRCAARFRDGKTGYNRRKWSNLWMSVSPMDPNIRSSKIGVTKCLCQGTRREKSDAAWESHKKRYFDCDIF